MHTHTSDTRSIVMECNTNLTLPCKILKTLLYLEKGQKQQRVKGSLGRERLCQQIPSYSPTDSRSRILNLQGVSELLGELVKNLDSWLPPQEVLT